MVCIAYWVIDAELLNHRDQPLWSTIVINHFDQSLWSPIVSSIASENCRCTLSTLLEPHHASFDGWLCCACTRWITPFLDQMRQQKPKTRAGVTVCAPCVSWTNSTPTGVLLILSPLLRRQNIVLSTITDGQSDQNPRWAQKYSPVYAA